jgi:hypothetical protein
VDTSNQYHIWVLKNPDMQFPVGWNERLTMSAEEAAKIGAKQRKL